MTALRSTLDPRSPAYAEAAAAMTAKLAELDAEHAKALAGGGDQVRRSATTPAAS